MIRAARLNVSRQIGSFVELGWYDLVHLFDQFTGIDFLQAARWLLVFDHHLIGARREAFLGRNLEAAFANLSRSRRPFANGPKIDPTTFERLTVERDFASYLSAASVGTRATKKWHHEYANKQKKLADQPPAAS